jgi:hypothetical protein
VDAFDGRRRREPAAESGTPLDGLLAEMRDLRLTLAADLTAAAGAAEEGADDVAAQIVDADRRELALFARDADRRLRRLQRGPQPTAAGPAAPRWRRRLVVALPVVPMVGALAVSAAAATGVLALPGSGTDQTSTLSAPALSVSAGDSASSTFREFADVIGGDPSASQVIAAAGRLHDQLAKLLASSSTDPGSAAQLVQLLRMEQSLLLTEQPPGADVVLHATRKLAAKLVSVVNAMTEPTTAPNVIPTFDYNGDSGNDDKNTATKPSPSPTKSSTSPKPTRTTSTSPTPAPSTSTYDPPPLPSFPQSDDD